VSCRALLSRCDVVWDDPGGRSVPACGAVPDRVSRDTGPVAVVHICGSAREACHPDNLTTVTWTAAMREPGGG
jgi:hypothetical protein